MSKEIISKTWLTSELTQANGRYYSDPADVPGGRFYVINPVASPVSLQRIYPLSDSELSALTAEGSAHWYQAAAVAGIPWKLPLGFMGGTYPYDYVLTGPVGAEIVYEGRSNLVPPFYEYILWTNPTMGSHEFELTCIDQEDNTTDTITFTLTVYDEDDTTNVGWVNPATGNNANAGSRSSPWADINGWYGGSQGSNTHRNKIILYEGATGINIGGVTGVSYANNNTRCRLNDNKPKVHIAIESFDVHGNGSFWNFEGGVGWTFCGPFVHDDAQVVDAITVPPEDGYRIQWFRGSNSCFRYGFIGMGYTATGGTYDPAEGSNSSFVEFPDNSGTPSDGFFFPNVILDGIGSSNERWSGVKNNNAYGVLSTGWEIANCSNLIGFHHKGVDIERTEERGVNAIDTLSNVQFRVVQNILNFVKRHDNTYCWNNYDTATSPPLGEGNGGTYLQGGGADDDFENQAGWRNNERIYSHVITADTGVFTLTRNVRVHNVAVANGIDDTGDMTVSSSAEYVSTTAGDLDATTNLLTGTARTNELGLVGCEMVEE